jgi:hypothetical protein
MSDGLTFREFVQNLILLDKGSKEDGRKPADRHFRIFHQIYHNVLEPGKEALDPKTNVVVYDFTTNLLHMFDWIDEHGMSEDDIVETLEHDIGGIKKREECFSPRVSGYAPKETAVAE